MTKRIKKYDVLFIFLFMIVFSFLLFKVRYGYIYNDEPYLLSLGYRFALGDAMLVEDWSIGQLVGFLIFPFMKLFVMLRNNTDYIVLYGRLCFILVWSLTTLYCYIRLRKYKYWAAIALMSFYLFAPLDMMTLSYNSFSLIGLIGMSSTIVSAKSPKEYIIVGLFLAIAVLCNPFIIFIYILFTVIFLINLALKNIYMPNKININKAWFYMTMGSFILLVIFVLFLLSRSNVNQIIDSIDYIINTNHEHPVLNTIELIQSYLSAMNSRFLIMIIFMPILITASIIDKNRYKRRLIYIIFSILITLMSFKSIIDNIEIYPNINLTVIPLIVVGIESFILTREKDYDVFIYFVVFGFIFSFLYHLSSNVGLPAIAFSYSIITVGSILLIGNLIIEIKQFNLSNVLLIIVICIQFSFQGYIRYNRYYLDGNIDELKYQIEVGPAKGIITNPTDWEVYSWHYQQFQMIMFDADEKDIFYYPYTNPWYYLATNMQIGTYSTWGSWGSPEQTNEINKDYFKVLPYKYPNYVLLNKNDDIQLNDLIEELTIKGYEIRETDDFILYLKIK